MGPVTARRLGRGCGLSCYSVGGYLAPELTRPFFERDRPVGLAPRTEASHSTSATRCGGAMVQPRRCSTSSACARAMTSCASPTGSSMASAFPTARGTDRRQERRACPPRGELGEHRRGLGTCRRGTTTVEFSGHRGKPTRVPWASVERTGQDRSHPVAYSARNSHASYPTAAPRKTQDNELCLGGPYARVLVRTARPGYALGSLGERRRQGCSLTPTTSRGKNGGAWGKAGEIADQTGPLGPSPYKLKNDRS